MMRYIVCCVVKRGRMKMLSAETVTAQKRKTAEEQVRSRFLNCGVYPYGIRAWQEDDFSYETACLYYGAEIVNSRLKWNARSMKPERI